MKPYHKNPRKINDKQLNDLRRWLDELGDLSGIVHDLHSDEIIGGNQRTAVLGFGENDITITERLPEPDRQGTVAHGYILWHGARYAYRQVAWTPEQCERANIIANKAGGDWEVDKLLSEFETAVLLDSGFGQDELDDMLAELEKGKVRETADAEPQTSRADELKQEWATETGQLWILPSRTEGQEHRLICGDCTDKAVVERVMSGEKADITFTSPPYNLGGNIAISNRSKSRKEAGAVYEGFSDNLAGSDYAELLHGFTDNALGVSDYVLVNIQQLAKNKRQVIEYLYRYKNHVADIAIWHKTNQQPAMARNVMSSSFEYIIFFSSEENPTRAIKTADFRGTFSNVYTSAINTNEYADIHGAAFPVEFAKHFLSAFCRKICLDVFGGLGTTIIASENLSRQCRAIEISPAYVAVALQRYYDTFQIRPYLAP